MRGLFYTLSALAVMGLAFWAYRENYATQEVLREVARLQREIGHTREALRLQEAEWAYLNRPERLRDLAELNYDNLHLVPLSSNHFGEVDQVAFPAPTLPELPELTGSIELSGKLVPQDGSKP